MAKTLVGKFLKKNKNTLLKVGIGAASIGAGLLIPGSGAAIKGVADKILGKNTGSTSEKVLGKKPGKGGLFGTGLFAGAKKKLENVGVDMEKLDAKEEELKNKIAKKASDLLGVPVDYDKAREVLTAEQMQGVTAAAGASGGTPAWLYLVGAAVAAKMFKII